MQLERLLEERRERGPPVLLLERTLGQLDVGVERFLEHRVDELLLGGEVPVERPHADAGPARDLLHGHADALVGEQLPGAGDDALAVPLCVAPKGHRRSVSHKRSVRSVSW